MGKEDGFQTVIHWLLSLAVITDSLLWLSLVLLPSNVLPLTDQSLDLPLAVCQDSLLSSIISWSPGIYIGYFIFLHFFPYIIEWNRSIASYFVNLTNCYRPYAGYVHFYVCSLALSFPAKTDLLDFLNLKLTTDKHDQSESKLHPQSNLIHEKN